MLEHLVSLRRLPVRRPWVRRIAALAPVLVVALSLGGAVAGCSSDPVSTMTPADGPGQALASSPVAATPQVAATPSVPMGAMIMPTADEVAAAWAARPGYVKDLPAEGQAAYAYALARPDVLQWLPCYCGCTGIPHRSNLDCYFVRREVKGTFAYEEHASFCDICIRTANMASEMLAKGSTMTQVRAAVDSTFGGGAVPGTDTPVPPVS
jgi:hypothetical protein